MNRDRKPKRKVNPTYCILVDGQTEQWYLQLMKHHENIRTINIKPELFSKKKLQDQFEFVKEYSSRYDKVVWIIDFDTIAKEIKESKSGESKLIELKKYFRELEKFKNVTLLVNNPCLEYWYLLHLKNTSKYYESYDKLIKEFNNTVLAGYEKTEKYYKKSNSDIYLKLKPYLVVATNRAAKLGKFDIANPDSAKAEIYELLEIIKSN